MVDRKEKYNYLRDKGFSPDDARRMRSWSWERVNYVVTGEYRDYNSPSIVKTEVNAEIKQSAEKRTEEKSKSEVRKIKYDYLRSLGYSSKVASKGRDWSWDRITNRTVWRERGKDELDFEKKRHKWSMWSSRKNYPMGIEKFAEEMNRRKGYDINSNIGWALAYYNYVEGYNMEMLWELDIEEEYL